VKEIEELKKMIGTDETKKIVNEIASKEKGAVQNQQMKSFSRITGEIKVHLMMKNLTGAKEAYKKLMEKYAELDKTNKALVFQECKDLHKKLMANIMFGSKEK